MFNVKNSFVQLRKTILSSSSSHWNIKIRLFATGPNITSLPFNSKPKSLADELPEFMSVLPDVKQDLIDHVKMYDPKYVGAWFEKALEYNLASGERFRGLATVFAYKYVADQSKLTPQNIRLAQFIGWCIELLQSSLVIMDDIVDGNTLRRGKQCWHCIDGVGMFAIADALMLECSSHHLIHKYFKHSDCYGDLLNIFRESYFATATGQALDSKRINFDLTKFSMEMHRLMTWNKTTMYSFYLPVAAAMLQAGIKDEKLLDIAKGILMEVGHLRQVQDDVMDCFEDPKLSGKYGTDIQEHKCTWLAIQCMQRASEEQKNIMKRCYGKKEVEQVAEVKQLYKDIGLVQYFLEYEKEMYENLQVFIKDNAEAIPKEIFLGILEAVLKKTEQFKDSL